MTVGIQVSSIGLHHIRSARCAAHDGSKLQQKESFLTVTPQRKFSHSNRRFSKSKKFCCQFHATSLPLHPLHVIAAASTHITWPADLAPPRTPPCLTNCLPLFTKPCFHGNRAESTQTAWVCSLSRPSQPSKSPQQFHNNPGTQYQCSQDETQ